MSDELAGTLDGSWAARRSALLEWGTAERRDLPWRGTRDPWAVLVAEVMSQQTQIDRVVPRWQRFLDRWPSTAAMAAAALGDVLVEWKGLGYPRRAKALHSAAVLIESEHEGVFPHSLEALVALPGIGAYTARAVQVFAFEADAGVLDTNVGRILARVSGERLTPGRAQRLADEAVPAGRSWEWNSAMLDLGAAVCRPSPDCDRCPIGGMCSWSVAGQPEPDPAHRSAAVSRPQARFEGSFRQARGRLLGSLSATPIALADLDPRDFAPHDPAAVAESLAGDGLVRLDGGSVSLP